MNGKRYFSAVTITAVVGVLLWSVTARAAVSYFGQGNVSFDSITVGKAGVGGVTYFNGTMVNQTSNGGVDNPVTIADDVRIDGRLFRGTTKGPGDGKPLTIDDDVTITGSLTANSISGLSAMVQSTVSASMAGFASTGEVLNLTVQNASQDITLGIHNDRLNSHQSELDVDYAVISAMAGIFDCMRTFSPLGTYLYAEDFEFCYDLWVSTLSTTPGTIESITEKLGTDAKAQREVTEEQKLQIERDRRGGE